MSRKDYFKLDESFDPKKDEVMEFLAADEGKEYSIPSPDKMMPLSKHEKMTIKEVAEWYMGKHGSDYSIFQKYRELQLQELHKSKRELKDFYTTAWDYSQYGNGKFTPMDISRLTLQKKIRVARIREVLDPQFAEVVVPHSKTKHKYIVARAYWWDDYGKRSRSVTKSIRRYEMDLIDRLRDIYEDMDFEIFTNCRLKNNAVADMVIRRKNEEYVVEIRKMDSDDLSRFILSMGMWDNYKKIYMEE